MPVQQFSAVNEMTYTFVIPDTPRERTIVEPLLTSTVYCRALLTVRSASVPVTDCEFCVDRFYFVSTDKSVLLLDIAGFYY
jgi:hypothetical protein